MDNEQRWITTSLLASLLLLSGCNREASQLDYGTVYVQHDREGNIQECVVRVGVYRFAFPPDRGDGVCHFPAIEKIGLATWHAK